MVLVVGNASELKRGHPTTHTHTHERASPPSARACGTHTADGYESLQPLTAPAAQAAPFAAPPPQRHRPACPPVTSCPVPSIHATAPTMPPVFRSNSWWEGESRAREEQAPPRRTREIEAGTHETVCQAEERKPPINFAGVMRTPGDGWVQGEHDKQGTQPLTSHKSARGAGLKTGLLWSQKHDLGYTRDTHAAAAIKRHLATAVPGKPVSWYILICWMNLDASFTTRGEQQSNSSGTPPKFTPPQLFRGHSGAPKNRLLSARFPMCLFYRLTASAEVGTYIVWI